MTSRRQAKRAMELHAESLSGYPNVVGLGIGRAGREDRPASERDHTLAVYVTEKKAVNELDPGEVLPGYVEIPGRGEIRKVAIQVFEIGSPELQDTENRDGDPPETSTFSAG